MVGPEIGRNLVDIFELQNDRMGHADATIWYKVTYSQIYLLNSGPHHKVLMSKCLKSLTIDSEDFEL